MSKLGRGFGALLPVPDEGSSTHEAMAGVRSVPVSEIRGNPQQPRKEFADGPLQELAESIREKGIIQPILVEKLDDGFQIVAGERRFRAAQIAGLREIPVLVRQYSDEERLEIALIENIQREDLTPLEEARAFRHLTEAFQLSQDEVAKKVGKQRSTVTNSLRLLKLPEDMQQALENRELTAGHARAILAVANPSDQRVLFGRIRSSGLSVREAEALALELNQGKEARQEALNRVHKGSGPRPVELNEIEQKFVDALGTKVQLKGNGNKGSLEIQYFSQDDLARLYEIFTKGDNLF